MGFGLRGNDGGGVRLNAEHRAVAAETSLPQRKVFVTKGTLFQRHPNGVA
ncbi:hypothetical protein [Bythopirellula polymerisocia]|uniref:Uncharacterized protein n=1 Tax=Bythopirellula polymerisocia TaxID=2528003 RepID=A0A5C6D2Z8_9BACT|nr:hypothetical protein [Bythopirellula polymerisocia]TWU29576.1 hypothetical protein Pla144_03540 [Bythopirellula polymerisocia]